MELIDRIAFMKDLAERTEANKDLCKDDIQYLQVVMVMNGFFQDLKEFPTVEVESRPKGKWLRKEYYFDEWVDECSVCGEAYVMIDGTATENGYNYCPNCGAYMVQI